MIQFKDIKIIGYYNDLPVIDVKGITHPTSIDLGELIKVMMKEKVKSLFVMHPTQSFLNFLKLTKTQSLITVLDQKIKLKKKRALV